MDPAVADTIDRGEGLSIDTKPTVQKDKSLDQKFPESLQHSSHDSPTAVKEENDSLGSPAQLVQKRRRVIRACDECRRKKVKCNGKQPCTHCKVYIYGLLWI